MSKDKLIEIDGTIIDVGPNKICNVELEGGKKIIAYLKGFFENRRIKVYPGNRVKVEFSPYDLEKGRISFKYPETENKAGVYNSNRKKKYTGNKNNNQYKKK
jgi:translation initiation factor IF-1